MLARTIIKIPSRRLVKVPFVRNFSMNIIPNRIWKTFFGKRWAELIPTSPSYNYSVSVSPVSRRNRKKTIDNHAYDFDTEVKKTLNSVKAAVEHMKPLNSVFDIVMEAEKLSISTPRGKFTLTADYMEQTLVLQSYISGYHMYVFDPTESVWRSVREDGHDMRGMLTRDMLRHCVGCPDFNQ